MEGECVFQLEVATDYNNKYLCSLAVEVVECDTEKCPFYQLWSMLKQIKEE